MKYKQELKAIHPYEDRDTTYFFSGVQKFDNEEFALYTADEGQGTTVCLETIIQREQKELMRR